MTITTFEGFGNIEPKTVATAPELDAFELPSDRSLPPSYRDYAEHLGYGLTCGLFLIYIPMGEHCDSLSVRSRVLSSVNGDGRLIEPSPEGQAGIFEAQHVSTGDLKNLQILACRRNSDAQHVHAISQ